MARFPDAQYLAIPFAQYDREVNESISTPREARERYYDDLEHPKPFFQSATVALENNEHVFTWEQSFDLQGDALYYTAIVAKDPALRDVVASVEKTRLTELRTKKLEPGLYYFQVIVEDEKGNEKGSFELYQDRDNDINYFGVKQVEVK